MRRAQISWAILHLKKKLVGEEIGVIEVAGVLNLVGIMKMLKRYILI